MSMYVGDSQLMIYPLRLPGGEWRWITSRSFSFQYGGFGGPIITVPQGFETDLGSIPPLVRVILSPSDPACAQAYVLHDWINTLTNRRPPGPGVWSSGSAASILYDALRVKDVPVWKAELIRTGVQLGIAKGEK